MQRLRPNQSVLVMVGEKMAVCTLAGFSDGAAVLRLTDRQRGGPMPDFSPDAQITFEFGKSLVVLNGTLQHGIVGEQLLFSVSDGVQVPPRRRDTRLQVRLPVTLRLGDGTEVATHTSDVSATGLGVAGGAHGGKGASLGVRLELPDATVVVATTSVVRVAGDVTALRIEHFEEGSRALLTRFVLTEGGSPGGDEPA